MIIAAISPAFDDEFFLLVLSSFDTESFSSIKGEIISEFFVTDVCISSNLLLKLKIS